MDGLIVFLTCSYWRQCAVPCAHWRHLANTIELVLPSAHPSPQPKWQINQFSHFCTAHGRKSLYFTMGNPFPQNCPFPWGSGPHVIYDFLGQSEPTIKMASWFCSAVFAQVTAECTYTLLWVPLLPGWYSLSDAEASSFGSSQYTPQYP